LGAGILIGAGLFSLVIAMLAVLGYYQVTGFNPWTVLVPAFALSVISGVVEELLFRGILFRILAGWLGVWISLFVSALVFGLLHLANPNASLWAGIAIAIEAGILLGVAFVLTGRLWLAIGIHFAWNFTQGGIFGMAVSGNESAGLLQGVLNGPPLLTGGSFGPEASILAVAACLTASAVMLRIAFRRGRLSRSPRPVLAPVGKQ
jgi:membrane protease YdiL (CAAX protease family)